MIGIIAASRVMINPVWASLNPVALWEFNEPSGSTIFNDSLNACNLTGGAGVTAGLQGKLNNSINCNGGGVAADYYLNSLFAGNFTMSVWLKHNSDMFYSAGRMIISKILSGVREIAFIGNNGLYIRLYNNANYIQLFIPASNFITNDWNHLVFTYNTTSSPKQNGMNVYLNGVIPAGLTRGMSGTFTGVANVNSPLKLGFTAESISNWGDGKFDQTCLFDKELTQSQVQQIYNNGNGLEY